jgi:hypothetical protein
MANSFKLDCGDGTSVQLNSRQLQALLAMPKTPPQYTSWPTYWALRNRGLIEGAQHKTATKLTERGEAALTSYWRQRGSKA